MLFCVIDIEGVKSIHLSWLLSQGPHLQNGIHIPLFLKKRKPTKILEELTEKTELFFKQTSYQHFTGSALASSQPSSNSGTIISLSCLYPISCHTILGPFNPWKYPLFILVLFGLLHESHHLPSQKRKSHLKT